MSGLLTVLISLDPCHLRLLKNLSVEEAAHRQLKGRRLELLEGSGTTYKSDAEPEMVRHVKSHQRALVSRFLGQ